MVYTISISEKEMKGLVEDWYRDRGIKFKTIKNFRLVCNHKKQDFKVVFDMTSSEKTIKIKKI